MSEELKNEIKQLVIARLQTLPEGMTISIGSEGDFSKEDLIKHVTAGDPIGQKIAEAEMDFLRSLKTGILYER